MTLEREMRTVLAQMALIQYGRTQSFSKSSRSEPDPRPSGEAHPLAETWREEWRRRPTRDTLDMARAELDAWKRSATVETDGSGFEDWVVEDGEGFAVAQVAGKFGIAEARVRRIRLKADRESEFGLPARFAHHRESAGTKEARVRDLTSKGCTLRQIALQTGVPRETVRRWMKEAA